MYSAWIQREKNSIVVELIDICKQLNLGKVE